MPPSPSSSTSTSLKLLPLALALALALSSPWPLPIYNRSCILQPQQPHHILHDNIASMRRQIHMLQDLEPKHHAVAQLK